MPLGIENIVLRVMRLEKWLRRLRDLIEDLADRIDALRLDQTKGRNNRDGEIVIVRPAEAIGPATFTEAVVGPPYVPAKILPDTGLGLIWQTVDPDTGELWALNTVRRWDEGTEAFVDEDARVVVDNVNPSETIPSTARYIFCVRRGGRLQAIVWECDPS